MSLKTRYLLLYNLLSLLVWATLLAHTCYDVVKGDLAPLLPLVTVAQTAQVAEVLHAALGLVRASPATTALQVGGRNLVVWTVMRRFPDLVFATAAAAPGYGRYGFVGCLLAWAASDVLRYAFFVAQMGVGRAPGALVWLRYSAFILLYPVGFLSEASLVYLGLVNARDISLFYRGYLFVGLLAYIPASYILYTYMFSQRRRALKQRGQVKKG